MVDSLICVCTHDKSEHNTPTHGCGAEKCGCTLFRDRRRIPRTDNTTRSIAAIEKVEIDESKLIERFNAKNRGIGKENPKNRERKIATKTKEWDLSEKYQSRIRELDDDHEEKLKEAEKWLKESFEDIDAWIQKGLALYNLWKSYAALQTFDTALLLCNRNTDKKDRVIETKLIRIYKYKGWTWEDEKEYAEAIICYKEGLKISADDDSLLSHIVWCHLQLSEYKEAQPYLETMLKINPNSAFAIDNMGYCYQSLENYPKALEYYQRSNKLDKDEDDHFALEKIMWVHWLQEDYDNAFKYANQLIEKENTDAETFYVKARVLIKRKEFDDAIISLQKSLSYNGIYAEVFFYLGLCYQNNIDHERFDLAILYYEKSLEFDKPGRGRAITYSNIGICYGALKEYEKALSWFDKALQDDPTFARSFIGKLEMYDNLEKWNEVIVSIVEQEAIDIKETISVDCLKFNRDALIGLRKLDEALECSKKLLEKKKSVNIYCWHGWILSELGCIDDAMKNFDMAIEIDREDEEGYRMKGLCSFDQEKYEDSVGLFQKAQELSTGRYESVDGNLLRKGRTIKKIGIKEGSKEKQKEAIAIFDEILKNDKNSRLLLTQAWIEKGHCNWNLSDYKKAEECYLKATELEPNAVSALICLGDIASVRRSEHEALAFFDKALLYDKTNIEIYLGKGRAFKNLKQFSESIKCYDEVLKLDDSISDAWFDKGSLFFQMDLFQRVIDHYEEFIEKFSDNRDVKYAVVNIASAQNSLKKYPDAINSCEKAFKIDNKFQFAFEQKIRALIGLEKYPDAIIWLEKSLNLPDCETRNTIKRLIKLNRRMGDIDKQKEYEKKLKELDEGT